MTTINLTLILRAQRHKRKGMAKRLRAVCPSAVLHVHVRDRSSSSESESSAPASSEDD